MAWTDGVDRATGYVITSTNWNALLGATGSVMFLKEDFISYQRTTKTSNQTITDSGAWTDITGLSFSMTPVASTNFTLIFFQLPAYTTNLGLISFRILRDSTVIQNVLDWPTSTSSNHPISMIVIDAPTAGTYTYKVQSQNNGSPGASTLYGGATNPIEFSGILLKVS